MRAALCISGNYRNYKETIYNIKNFSKLFQHCDIFMLYDVNEKKNETKEIINILKPKKYKSVTSINDCPNMNMWYKIKEAYLICENYMKKFNIKYDIIIRCRYDLFVYNDKNLNLNQINVKDNSLYIFTAKNKLFRLAQNITYHIQKIVLHDIFFGNPETMRIYCIDFYNLLKKSKNKCLEYNLPEVNLFRFSDFLNTNIIQLPINYELNSFKKDFFGYSKKKLVAYPSFIKTGLNIKLLLYIIIIILISVIVFWKCPKK